MYDVQKTRHTGHSSCGAPIEYIMIAFGYHLEPMQKKLTWIFKISWYVTRVGLSTKFAEPRRALQEFLEDLFGSHFGENQRTLFYETKFLSVKCCSALPQLMGFLFCRATFVCEAVCQNFLFIVQSFPSMIVDSWIAILKLDKLS